MICHIEYKILEGKFRKSPVMQMDSYAPRSLSPSSEINLITPMFLNFLSNGGIAPMIKILGQLSTVSSNLKIFTSHFLVVQRRIGSREHSATLLPVAEC